MVVLKKIIKAGTFTSFLDSKISLYLFRIIFIVFLTVLQRGFYLIENNITICLGMTGKLIYSTLRTTVELNWGENEYLLYKKGGLF